MDAIEKALAHLDAAVEKLDKKIAKSKAPAGAIRQIIRRDANNRVAFVDTVPLTAEMIAERER